MPQRNLLDKWLEHAKLISSPFNPWRSVGRRQIEFIEEQLLAFFGRTYFDIKAGADSPIGKISWIFSLLSNENNLGCITALLEVATLLQYAQTQEDHLRNELNNLKYHPTNLRSFFFELFVFKHLDQAKITNKKKFIVGKQEVEGICEIASKTYLFECRKIFLPKIAELDIKRRLIMDFDRYGKKMTKGIGMICTIHFTWPINPGYRTHFGKHIETFFEKLQSASYVTHIDYHVTDKFGSFKVQDYDEANLIEIRDLKTYDILHYIIPPKNQMARIPECYHGKIQARFVTLQSAILKKLEAVLKEKKEQHRDSPYSEQIIFIDSDTLPEFNMGLFVNEMMFEPEKIAALCNKIHPDHIVCLIRRRYLTEGYEVLADSFGDTSKKEVMDLLNQIFRQPLVVPST